MKTWHEILEDASTEIEPEVDPNTLEQIPLTNKIVEDLKSKLREHEDFLEVIYGHRFELDIERKDNSLILKSNDIIENIGKTDKILKNLFKSLWVESYPVNLVKENDDLYTATFEVVFKFKDSQDGMFTLEPNNIRTIKIKLTDVK